MKQKILNDLTQAMKDQDKELLSVLRMVKGSIQLEEIKVKHELNDEEVISIVTREIKTRKDSINEFEKGNRTDLIEKTASEIELLNKYMPEQLSEEDVNKIIDDVFTKVSPKGQSDMGKVMGMITPLVKGKTDMSLVSSKIKEKLSNL